MHRKHRHAIDSTAEMPSSVVLEVLCTLQESSLQLHAMYSCIPMQISMSASSYWTVQLCQSCHLPFTQPAGSTCQFNSDASAYAQPIIGCKKQPSPQAVSTGQHPKLLTAEQVRLTSMPKHTRSPRTQQSCAAVCTPEPYMQACMATQHVPFPAEAPRTLCDCRGSPCTP